MSVTSSMRSWSKFLMMQIRDEQLKHSGTRELLLTHKIQFMENTQVFLKSLSSCLHVPKEIRVLFYTLEIISSPKLFQEVSPMQQSKLDLLEDAQITNIYDDFHGNFRWIQRFEFRLGSELIPHLFNRSKLMIFNGCRKKRGVLLKAMFNVFCLNITLFFFSKCSFKSHEFLFCYIK